MHVHSCYCVCVCVCVFKIASSVPTSVCLPFICSVQGAVEEDEGEDAEEDAAGKDEL